MISGNTERAMSGPDRGRFVLCAVVLLLGMWFEPARAAGPFIPVQPVNEVGLDLLRDGPNEPPRLVGSVLAVMLGPFGGHRLYFGTSTKVPIIYVLTLGGGFGVLPMIDLVHILFTKDLDRFRNNDRVLMWTGRKNRPG